MTVRKITLVTLATVVATTVTAAVAAHAAPTAQNGALVQPFATGFPAVPRDASQIGPLGVAFDHTNRLFVADTVDGNLYRFAGAGQADATTRLATVGKNPSGIAVDADDSLFVARAAAGDVVEVDPGDGHVVRTVADGLGCVLGLAADPISGDLFLTRCRAGSGVYRIVDVSSNSPTLEPFSVGFAPDGVAVAADGTVFAVDDTGVYRIEGLGGANPGKRTQFASVPNGDGIALSLAGGGTPEFVIVNRTDGVVTRIDMVSNTQTDLVTGGERGDFATVGFDGCLYVTQGDSVQRISNSDGSCGASPGGPVGGLAPTTPLAPAAQNAENGSIETPPKGSCVDRRGFKFRLHHARGQRVVAVVVFIDGKLRKRATGRNIKTISIKPLPQGRFKVRIVATHSSGSKLVSKRNYVGCKKGRPRTRRGGRRR